MIIREEYLVVINSKNKIQRILLQLDQDDSVFHIYRITGQYGGKETFQPVITVDKGKVKRTVAEQATLLFNSKLKSYLDKGYVKLKNLTDKKYSDLSENEIKELLGGDIVSDQSGVPKPMLAIQSDKCASSSFEKEWYCSRKINGVRCLMYYKDGKVLTASRGGGEYNVSTQHITSNPIIIKFFEDHPNIILDGELYSHGASLQYLSGISRLKTWDEKCTELQYWIYDYISSEIFEDRYKHLMEFKELFKDVKSIKVLDHIKISGYINISKLHDSFVNEGFEGLVMRNPNKEYGINKRSAIYMIKVKLYKDAEFPIVGYENGLRPEDMVFILKAENNKKFKAKPIGPAELKLEYLENINSYIGKKATIKYFELSDDGTPLQPILIHIRPEDE